MTKCINCGKEEIVYPAHMLCFNCGTALLEKMKTEQAQESMATTQAIKADNGKPRLDLVPLEVLEPLAKVREFAFGKYGENGINKWHEIEDERYLAALLRHLVAYQKDNNAVDDESGLPAIYHVLCNAAFLAIKHMRTEEED